MVQHRVEKGWGDSTAPSSFGEDIKSVGTGSSQHCLVGDGEDC